MIAVLLAFWVRFLFTSPADNPGGNGVARYEAQRSFDGGATWSTASLFARPDPVAPDPVPAAPGQRDSAFASLSGSTARWWAGGECYRLRAVDRDGNAADWSNMLVAIAGPDTLWCLTRPEGGSLRTLDGRWAQAGTVAAWSLLPGDTARAAGRHFERVQLDHLQAICRLYGYYGMRGVRIPCP